MGTIIIPPTPLHNGPCLGHLDLNTPINMRPMCARNGVSVTPLAAGPCPHSCPQVSNFINAINHVLISPPYLIKDRDVTAPPLAIPPPR